MLRKSKWNDPKSSIGRYYCNIPGRARSYKCWEAIGPAQTLWKDVLEKKVERCLNNSGQTFPTSVGKSMYMFGRREESAQPIIIFCCPEKEWREVAMNTVLHSGLLRNHPGVIAGARHLPPEAADDWQDLPTDKSVEWSPYEVLYIPSERSCGVRIFIRAKGGSQQRGIRLRKATGGGIIRCGEQYYYLTAAHAFGDKTTFQDYVRFQQEMSLDDDSFKFGVEADDDADEEEDSDEHEHLVNITSKGSTTSDSDESSTTSAELSSADTQQLDLQLENNEDADRSSAQFEDTSQATSVSSKDISYEVLGNRLSFTAATHLDFALINIKTPHLCAFNEIRWQSGAETKIVRPERIALKPKNANIVTVTGSAGVLEGYLSGTPSFWNVPHSSILCQFWTVRLAGILSNGDCGSWVVDAETGDLYGHIVAGSPSNGVAYIVPTCQIQDYLENSVEACTFELSTGSSSPSMELKKLHSEAIRDPEICEYEREDIRFSPAQGGRPRPREVGIQIMDLQQQLEQLAAQNRPAKAEEAVQAAEYQRQVDSQAVTEAVEARDREIRQKDIDIAQLKDTLQRLREEVARPTELNNTLTEANRNFTNNTNERYAQLQAEDQQVHQQWQQLSRELEELRAQNAQMTSGMEEAVRAKIGLALDERNAEIERLNAEYASAKEQIKTLQKQISLSKVLNESFLTVRDENYFDGACRRLCLHVQQWVSRFSKFSDARACRLSSEIAADTKLDGVTWQKIDTRLDNAILDGSDVDMRLADRVRRQDVFMSVVMTMIWEFIFTRYLFGMDREQRQKLKSLEKTLSEVSKYVRSSAISHANIDQARHARLLNGAQ